MVDPSNTPGAPSSRPEPPPGTRLKNKVFAVWGILLVLMVGLPPLYLAASRAEPWIVLPFSVNYLLLHGLLAVLMVLALYLYESRRGELELFQEGEEVSPSE